MESKYVLGANPLTAVATSNHHGNTNYHTVKAKGGTITIQTLTRGTEVLLGSTAMNSEEHQFALLPSLVQFLQ